MLEALLKLRQVCCDLGWNLAVERLATDRAHCIRQKNGLVYKLVIAGSVEACIVALQERKAALAAVIIESKVIVKAPFSKDDLTSLFRPLGASMIPALRGSTEKS